MRTMMKRVLVSWLRNKFKGTQLLTVGLEIKMSMKRQMHSRMSSKD